jgi:hypothetical protein
MVPARCKEGSASHYGRPGGPVAPEIYNLVQGMNHIGKECRHDRPRSACLARGCGPVACFIVACRGRNGRHVLNVQTPSSFVFIPFWLYPAVSNQKSAGFGVATGPTTGAGSTGSSTGTTVTGVGVGFADTGEKGEKYITLSSNRYTHLLHTHSCCHPQRSVGPKGLGWVSHGNESSSFSLVFHVRFRSFPRSVTQCNSRTETKSLPVSTAQKFLCSPTMSIRTVIGMHNNRPRLGRVGHPRVRPANPVQEVPARQASQATGCV